MATINSLTDLENIGDDSVVETFMLNLTLIFQYAQTDIIETLDKRSDSSLTALRERLCDEIKSNFPAYQLRRPISRRVKHLFTHDIFHLGYSIVNEGVSREAEKAFDKANDEEASPVVEPDEEDDTQLNGEMAQLISTVAKLQETVNSLRTENKMLTKRIDELPVCKCAVSHEDRTIRDEPPVNQAGNSTTAVVEQVVKACSSKDDAAVEVSSNSSNSSSDSENESTDQRDQRSKKRKKSKTGSKNKCLVAKSVLKASNAPSKNHVAINPQSQLKAASISSAVKEIYVGNVSPESSASDIADHIKDIATPIATKDVRELYKGPDAKSFCVKVPESDFHKVVGATWPTGIKVRQFYPRSNGANHKKNQRGWHRNRGPHQGVKAANRRGQYRGQPKNTYQEQPFRVSPDYNQSDWYDSEWPPLSRSTQDRQWEYQHDERYYDTWY